MHGLLRPLGWYQGKARVKGRLYDVGGYPGLVLDGMAGPVQGELYRLERPGRAFRVLDGYEGCRPPGAGEGEYRRVRCGVIVENGMTARAWVYEYARSVDGLTLLPEGGYFLPKARRRVAEGLKRR